jgi:hypothetical protein
MSTGALVLSAPWAVAAKGAATSSRQQETSQGRRLCDMASEKSKWLTFKFNFFCNDIFKN